MNTKTQPNNAKVAFGIKKAAKPARMRQRARMTARKAAKRGLISEKAMKKHMGEVY
jgi:hypothetical protein